MTDFHPMNLLHSVDLSRKKVLLNRYACETELARTLHYNLLEKLDQMATDLLREIAIWQELTVAKGTSRQADFDFEIYYEPRCPFEAKWIQNGPISLLDPIDVVIVAMAEGATASIRVDYAEVPPAELEGLGEIMDQIAKWTAVRFVAALVLDKGEAS